MRESSFFSTYPKHVDQRATEEEGSGGKADREGEETSNSNTSKGLLGPGTIPSLHNTMVAISLRFIDWSCL